MTSRHKYEVLVLSNTSSTPSEPSFPPTHPFGLSHLLKVVLFLSSPSVFTGASAVTFGCASLFLIDELPADSLCIPELSLCVRFGSRSACVVVALHSCICFLNESFVGLCR